MVSVFDRSAVLAAISPERAVESTREAFVRHHRGEWTMPAKVYLDSPPHGDFRAMPARGEGLAILKWVTSFPGNPVRGLPVVTGALLVSDAGTGELVAILDCGAVTSLRTGAAAAVSAQALARAGAVTVGLIGCGENGAWAARCLAAVGYGHGICCDLDRAAAERLAAELGWETGGRKAALERDVVVLVTPGDRIIAAPGELGAGTHLVAAGADAHGKSEVAPELLASCSLFCDEWEQAARGGELSRAVDAGLVARDRVVEIGAVLDGEAPGRSEDDEITVFDSTGLAIQDLGIAVAVLSAWRGGETAPSGEIEL